jgi:hypothetical protein
MSQPQTSHVQFTKEPIQTLEPQDRCTNQILNVGAYGFMEPAACHPSDALNFEVPLDFVKSCELLSPKACNLEILPKYARSKRRTTVLTH